MEKTLYEKLKDVPVGEQIGIGEENKLSVIKSEDLKEKLELVESESAFHVYDENNEVIGSLTLWNNGTTDFFSYIREEDFGVDYASDLVRHVFG